MTRWRRFRQLSWSERGFLLFAAGGLAIVGITLPLAGFERTVTWIRRSSRAPRNGVNIGASEAGKAIGANQGNAAVAAFRAGAVAKNQEWARRCAYLVSVAARFGPYRATCLRRSLFLWWLTRRRGMDSQLQIGVRRDQQKPSELLAHAWIELDGEVVNDRAEVVAGYAAFDARRLPNHVSWS